MDSTDVHVRPRTVVRARCKCMQTLREKTVPRLLLKPTRPRMSLLLVFSISGCLRKINAGSPTPINPPSYIGMRWTGQEVILRLTTVPAGYTGGNAFRHLSHVINQLWKQQISCTHLGSYLPSNNLDSKNTVAVEPLHEEKQRNPSSKDTHSLTKNTDLQHTSI